MAAPTLFVSNMAVTAMTIRDQFMKHPTIVLIVPERYAFRLLLPGDLQGTAFAGKVSADFLSLPGERRRVVRREFLSIRRISRERLQDLLQDSPHRRLLRKT